MSRDDPEIFFLSHYASVKTGLCKSPSKGLWSSKVLLQLVTIHSGWEVQLNSFYIVFTYRERKKKSAESWTWCSPLLVFSLKLCNSGSWKCSKCLGTYFFSPRLAPSLQSADAEPLLQEPACSEKHFSTVYSAVSVAAVLALLQKSSRLLITLDLLFLNDE